MLANRLPVLSAFAGGCLSGALLIGFFAIPALRQQGALHRGTDAFAPPVAMTSAERAFPDDAASAPTAEPDREPALAQAVDHDRNAAPVEPSAQTVTSDVAAPPTEPGSSVADVLARLEGAYRKGLTAAPGGAPANGAAPQTTAASAAPQTTAASVDAPAHEAAANAEAPVALANAAVPPTSATQAVVEPGLATQAVAQPALAPAPAAPPVLAPQGPAQPMLVPQVGVEQALAPQAVAPTIVASQSDMRPRDVYYGDVQQNVYLGNVHQGDVYQMQQLAILQYMQLLALSPYAQFTPRARAPRGMRAAPAPAFTSTLTNPDNPWGFKYPPTVLVK